MNPGSVDPLPGVSLEDLIIEAHEIIKKNTKWQVKTTRMYIPF
jgi:hypothetical protein